MAVPVALPTNIRYKGVDYPHGTPIVFTESRPLIEITFDNTDFTNARVYTFAGTAWQADYNLREYRGGLVSVSSTQLQLAIHIIVDSGVLSVIPYNTDGQGSGKSWNFTVSLDTGDNYSWQHLGMAVIRDTLIANMTAEELALITEDGTVKIVHEGVDDTLNNPFIVCQQLTGGDMNSAQVPYGEFIWRVTVHTPSHYDMSVLEEAIHRSLARQDPVVNFSNVFSAGEIEEATPLTDRYQVQNVPIFVSGATYRIRLSKG